MRTYEVGIHGRRPPKETRATLSIAVIVFCQKRTPIRSHERQHGVGIGLQVKGFDLVEDTRGGREAYTVLVSHPVETMILRLAVAVNE